MKKEFRENIKELLAFFKVYSQKTKVYYKNKTESDYNENPEKVKINEMERKKIKKTSWNFPIKSLLRRVV